MCGIAGIIYKNPERQVDADVATYMELETLGPFVQHQLLMQARKLWPTGQGSNADRPGGV